MQSSTDALENNLVVPKIISMCPNKFTSRNIPKNIENICPYKDFYMNVHSIIHNDKDGNSSNVYQLMTG